MSYFSRLATRAALLTATGAWIAGATSVFGSADAPAEPDAAVGELPVASAPTKTEVAVEPSSVVRVDLPVAWQLTHMRTAPGAASSMVTESFRETWTIEQRPAGTFLLQSPRARVEAFASAGEGAPALPAVWPRLLMLSESDFARLIGLPEPEAEHERELGAERFVTLGLGRQGRGSSDIHLRLSEDHSAEVQVEVGSQSLF